MGRIGIPRLIKVPSISSTIEIGTFPGPTSSCASWNVREPLASHARIRSPLAFLYSLNAKCWSPANLLSASSSLRTLRPGSLYCWTGWLPSPSSQRSITSISPASMHATWCQQALVRVGVNVIHNKVRMMQNFLDEILQFCCSSLVLFDMFLYDVFTGREHAGVLSIQWKQVPSLAAHEYQHVKYHAIYHVI